MVGGETLDSEPAAKALGRETVAEGEKSCEARF